MNYSRRFCETMTSVHEIFSFSEWLQILHDLNFRESDVQLVKDRLTSELSAKNNRFRFLEGSPRKSPRFRSRDCAGIIVQHLGDRRYLARTSSRRRRTPSNDGSRRQVFARRERQEVSDCVRFVIFDETGPPDPQNTRTVFEWRLRLFQGHSRSLNLRFRAASSSSERTTVSGDVETVTCVGFRPHFESYVSCRKRFVVVVGPPCATLCDSTNSYQPTNCVFDAEKETMKIFHLKRESGGEVMHGWAANVSFDPRPNGEPVAAMIVCRTKSDHLPRSGQTGSLIRYDFRQEKVLHELTDAVCHTSGLQYTCSGEHLLTSLVVGGGDASSSGATIDDVIAGDDRRCRIAMLSADDLTLLRLLPVFPEVEIATLDTVLSSALSTDRRKMALFLRNDNNNNNNNNNNTNNNNNNNKEGDERCRSYSHENDYFSSVKVVLIHFPVTVQSLQRICLDVVETSISNNTSQSLYSLPIPKSFFDKLGVGNDCKKVKACLRHLEPTTCTTGS